MNPAQSTGLSIGSVEVVVGTKLTSEHIHFDADEDITKASGNFLTVEYNTRLAAFSVRHSKSHHSKLLAEFLEGWEVSVFDVKP